MQSEIDRIKKVETNISNNFSFYMLSPFYNKLFLKLNNKIKLLNDNDLEKFSGIYSFNSNKIYLQNKNNEFFSILDDYLDRNINKNYSIEYLNILIKFPYTFLFKLSILGPSVSELTISDLIYEVSLSIQKAFSFDIWNNKDIFSNFKNIFIQDMFINKNIYINCLYFALNTYVKRSKENINTNDSFEKEKEKNLKRI